MGTELPPASHSELNALSVRIPASHRELFVQIQEAWNKAEEAVKRSEQIAIDVTIPSVTELRYAGRRIVDALNLASAEGDHDQKIRALLEDARFCCHRAQHDAIDVALAKIGIDLDNLTSKLGFEAVIRAYPPFQEFYATFAVAQEQVANSRHKREERNAIYDTIGAVDLPELIKRYKEIMVVRPIAKKFARQMFLGSINGILLTALAIAGVVLAAMAVNWSEWLPPRKGERAVVIKAPPTAPPLGSTSPAS